MLSKNALARAAALTGAVAMIVTAVPAEFAFAQQTPSVALEQARKGEDGTTGTGADPGSMKSGGKRDSDGNGGNASAGGAGEVATADGSSGSTEDGGPPLPENAEVLSALGILDDVTVYGLDVLSGLDIPVEILPPPPAETAPSAPDDVNTGGHGDSGSTVSTEPGGGSAPAGGSTNSVSEDGTGSTSTGEKPRDRPRKNADGATDSATTTDTSGSGDTATGS